jgi:hypothetical protein
VCPLVYFPGPLYSSVACPSCWLSALCNFVASEVENNSLRPPNPRDAKCDGVPESNGPPVTWIQRLSRLFTTSPLARSNTRIFNLRVPRCRTCDLAASRLCYSRGHIIFPSTPEARGTDTRDLAASRPRHSRDQMPNSLAPESRDVEAPRVDATCPPLLPVVPHY